MSTHPTLEQQIAWNKFVENELDQYHASGEALRHSPELPFSSDSPYDSKRFPFVVEYVWPDGTRNPIRDDLHDCKTIVRAR